MIQALHSGASGLRSQQINMDVIANNVANINTYGFKQSRLDFKDLMYNRMVNQVDNGEHMNLQHGTGVRELQMNTIFSQGNVVTSDRWLDMMIEGNGFFSVEGNDGETLYTRDGAFKLSVEEGGAYLVTSDGRYVLDENAGRIFLPGDPMTMKFTVSEDGALDLNDQNGFSVRLGIADFINPAGLEDAGHNFFRETDNSGTAQILLPAETRVKQSALEGSNVDLANESTRLIRAQRAYQLASRAVTTADQMMGIATSIRQ